MWPLKWIFAFVLLVLGLGQSTAPDRHGAATLAHLALMAIAVGLLVRDAVLLRKRGESEIARRARRASAGLLVLGIILGVMRIGGGPVRVGLDVPDSRSGH